MAYMMLLDVLIAYVLDLVFGDPYWFPHPVRFIGWMISRSEKLLRRFIKGESGNTAGKERRAGIILAAFVVISNFLIVYLILLAAASISTVLFHVLNIYFIYSSFAARCMGDEATKVYRVLEKGDIHQSRKQLAMLVGRETDRLDENEIIRGVVETTAENTVDGVISPIIYSIIGSVFGLGAPLVYAFKAVSTLDSMVGYMNDRYINFGRASAKLDDAANYIPARLSGILIPAAAFLCGRNFFKSFSIMRRDRRNHKSPNCAYPEAAVAGALGIRIGGTNVYFGQVVEKPTIGDPDKPLEIRDITGTVRIMYIASLLTLVLVGGLAAAVFNILEVQNGI